MSRRTRLAEQIADLHDPTPKDFDPEDDVSPSESEDDDKLETEDEGKARDHYQHVGKSELRSREELILGPQYAGSKISRQNFEASESEDSVLDEVNAKENARTKAGESSDSAESSLDVDGAIDSQDESEIDSEEAFGEGDIERFRRFTFLGSKAAGETMDVDEEDGGVELNGTSKLNGDLHDSFHGFSSEEDLNDGEDLNLSNESEDSTHSDEGNEQEDDDDSLSASDMDEDSDAEFQSSENDDRAQLRKMMTESEKSITASISQAAKADAEKGHAVKQQRLIFDSYLNTRIRLQKSLVAANTFPTLATIEQNETPDSDAYKATEEAAIRLWTTIDDLRLSLSSDTKKRKRYFTPSASTPERTLWQHMQTYESNNRPVRKQVLDKWSSKIRNTTVLSTSQRLGPSDAPLPLSTVLTSQLHNSERLVAKTRIPRSCAPVQASTNKGEELEDIFDDADFYQMLLRELVDQRMGDAAATAATAMNGVNGEPKLWSTVARESRTKRKVDTRASKGRKMRYTIHEKLQNFMAREDRTVWGERQKDELFGSLLGAKMPLREDSSEEDDVEASGLRLFSNSVINS